MVLGGREMQFRFLHCVHDNKNEALGMNCPPVIKDRFCENIKAWLKNHPKLGNGFLGFKNYRNPQTRANCISIH